MKTDEELRKDLKRICWMLRKLMRDAGPGGEIYVAKSTINLMRGPHHLPGTSAKPNPDAIIVSEIVHGVDGGDW